MGMPMLSPDSRRRIRRRLRELREPAAPVAPMYWCSPYCPVTFRTLQARVSHRVRCGWFARYQQELADRERADAALFV